MSLADLFDDIPKPSKRDPLAKFHVHDDADDSDDDADVSSEDRAAEDRVVDEGEGEDSSETVKKTADLSERREEDPRTLFVSNVPFQVKRTEFKALFTATGANVVSVRFRSIALRKPNIPKNRAFHKGNTNAKRTSMHAYVVFESVADARKGLAVDAQVLLGHRLFVNFVLKTRFPPSRTMYVGNLPFEAEDQDIFEIFDPISPVESIRLVRDPHLGIGKGFGYVCFRTRPGLNNAFALQGHTMGNRTLRLSRAKHESQAKKSKYKTGLERKKKKTGKWTPSESLRMQEVNDKKNLDGAAAKKLATEGPQRASVIAALKQLQSGVKKVRDRQKRSRSSSRPATKRRKAHN